MNLSRSLIMFPVAVLVLVISFGVSAATTEATTEEEPPRHSLHSLHVAYSLSLLGIAIPVKHGPSAQYSLDSAWAIEAGHFAGQFGLSRFFIDIGSFRESLLLINARYHPVRGSFSWIFGLSRQSYRARLGDDFLSRVTSQPADYEAVTAETLGLQLGLSNQFRFNRNFILGIDWIVVNVPFLTLKSEAPILGALPNPSDRDRIEDLLRIMRYLPTAVLLKTSVGYSF
jgi:hypothetical protein